MALLRFKIERQQVSTVLHTGPDVDELFKAKVSQRGLPTDKIPTAVVMAVQQMTTSSMPFMKLVGELPPHARGFEWMELLYSAFAEWCSHTVVTDDQGND